MTTTSKTSDLAGKIALVTGASTGIGKEIARGLARTGATVVLGVRDVARGGAARDEIAADTGSDRLFVMRVDVADQASVRAFAKELAARFDALSVLVNNAGAWFSDRRESPDGLELTFATNVVGPYLLTKLLEPMLERGAPARVVNVVSGLASSYDASDLSYARRPYDGFKAYAQSKQALRMLTWAQAERLAAKRVTVNAAAPGFVRTEFNRNASGFTAAMIGLSARLFGVTPAKGAETPLWAAVDASVEGVTGKLFDGLREKDGKFHDRAAIADLEERLEAMTTAGGELGAAPPPARRAADAIRAR